MLVVLPLIMSVSLLLLNVIVMLLVVGVGELPMVLLSMDVAVLLLDVVLGVVLMVVIFPGVATGPLLVILLVVMGNDWTDNGLTVNSGDGVEDGY
jgi:hypothetical protein